MRSLPPLTALRAFEAAARLLSFQDAAKELNLTPTAISHQIRLLEDYCGQSLFRRRPRPLSLTPSGLILLPPVSQGLDLFAGGLSSLSDSDTRRLKITATNAFAARWIMPKVAAWRTLHPQIGLDISGTDDVLDLASDQVDIAIRYARQAPKGLTSLEVGRDIYVVVASPALVGSSSINLMPKDFLNFPLIDGQWDQGFANPPMWFEWMRVAKDFGLDVPDLTKQIALSFREDLHGIEAAIAGYGIAICSNVLVMAELESGALVQVSDITLEGYRYFVTHRPKHPRQSTIKMFEKWVLEQFQGTP